MANVMDNSGGINLSDPKYKGKFLYSEDMWAKMPMNTAITDIDQHGVATMYNLNDPSHTPFYSPPIFQNQAIPGASPTISSSLVPSGNSVNVPAVSSNPNQPTVYNLDGSVSPSGGGSFIVTDGSGNSGLTGNTGMILAVVAVVVVLLFIK